MPSIYYTQGPQEGVNLPNTHLYRISTLADVTAPGAAGYWAGFRAADPTALGEQPTLCQVWAEPGGYFLFLQQAAGYGLNSPSAEEQQAAWLLLETTLKAMQPNLAPPGQLRLLWVNNSNPNPASWEYTPGQASHSGSGNNLVWRLERSLTFKAGPSHKMVFPGQQEISLAGQGPGGNCQATGIQFGGQGLLAGPGGSHPLSPGTLPLSGPALGVPCGTATAAATANAASSFWNTMRVGLQYGKAPLPPALPGQGQEEEANNNASKKAQMFPGAVQTVYMPVFQGQNYALSLAVQLDPLFPLVPGRSAMYLPLGLGPKPSYMRTTRGYATTLSPAPASEGVPAPRLVFGASPTQVGQAPPLRYHLCPEGAFDLAVTPPEGGLPKRSAPQEEEVPEPDDHLLLGSSALEYIALPTGTPMQLLFQSGQAAFAPVYNPAETQEHGTAPPALTTAATTAYAALRPSPPLSTALTYYAQPQQAPLYAGTHQALGSNVLAFKALPALSLSHAPGTLPSPMPMGIYAGLGGAAVPFAQQLEQASLAPHRHALLQEAYSTDEPAPPGNPGQGQSLGVTPQGLVMTLAGQQGEGQGHRPSPAQESQDDAEIQGLHLANMPGTAYPEVNLTQAKGGFKAALQSNQLFFVASNVDELMQGTSVSYQLTTQDKPQLRGMGVPEAVITAVYANTGTSAYLTEDAFVAAIDGAAGDYQPSFLYVAGLLRVEMNGWTFQLSPRSWRRNPQSPTLLVAKFANRPLLELAKDAQSWAWPQVANSSSGMTQAQTQAKLLEILLAANAPEAPEDYHQFYNTVVTDPSWNGFLFFNAPVNVTGLPPELQFLTAGLDLAEFYAHHIGFSQTPFNVQGGEPQLQQTAAFGLVRYQNLDDLYTETTVPLAFKTMLVNARFANAALANFSTQVELMVNTLFGAPLQKANAQRGNNLIINGSYQQVGQTPGYAFALTGHNTFNAFNTALASVEVLAVQLLTGQQGQGAQVSTTFMLNGALRFANFSEFDLFSYGSYNLPHNTQELNDSYLLFNGLAINMSFSAASPAVQHFTVVEDHLGVDGPGSTPRPQSLANNFPLQVGRLVASPNLTPEAALPTGQSPEAMGYTSIAAPLAQRPMVPPWYGVEYTLDLGTLGALAGSLPLKVNVLAAWCEGPSQESAPVYLGLRLPQVPAVGGHFPLQGVLRLGFRSFQFESHWNSDTDTTTYLLRLRRLALSLLSLSFPPGNTDIVLFGQPGNPQGPMGWYAAYENEPGNGPAPSPKLLAEKATEASPENKPETNQLKGRRTPPLT